MKRTLSLLLLAVVACSKKPEPPPTPAAPPSPVVAAPSASVAKVATPLRKLAPESVSASSEYDKPAEKHLALDAFDGDVSSAWTESVKGPGKGEWLEAKFHGPQHLRKVRVVPGYEGTSATAGDLFVANAHVKTLRLRFDDDAAKDVVKEIGEAERSVTIDVDITATKIRLLADDVWAGKKWEDLAVAEIELWGDDSPTPSGMSVASLTDLDTQLNKLDMDGWKASTPEPAKLLASLGFGNLKALAYARVDTATRTTRQLDGDEGEESIVELTVFNQGDAENKTFYQYFWIFLDDAAHGNAILGRRVQMTVACRTELADDPGDAGPDAPDAKKKTGKLPRGNLAQLSTQKIHDKAIDDIFVHWESTRECGEKTVGARGAFVASLSRGALDIVANWSAPFSDEKALSLQIFGDPPSTLEITDDGATKSKLTFDPALYRYR